MYNVLQVTQHLINLMQIEILEINQEFYKN